MPEVHWADPNTREQGDMDVPDDIYQRSDLADVRGAADDGEVMEAWEAYLADATNRETVDALINAAKVPSGGGRGGGGADAPQSQPSSEYDVVNLKAPITVKVAKKSMYGKSPVSGAPAPPPVDIPIPAAQFYAGPPGSNPETFPKLLFNQQERAWNTYLQTNDLPKYTEAYGSSSFSNIDEPPAKVVERMETDDDKKPVNKKPVNRIADCLSAIRNNPKTSTGIALVIAILLTAIEEALRNTVGNQPTGVTATPTWKAAGASTVTVAWTAPSYTGFSYTVSLTNPAGLVRSLDVDGAMTSTSFDKVADGTYSVAVTARRPATASATATTNVTVAAPAGTPPTPVAPAAPASVTLVISPAMGASGRGITVSWVPGTGGGAPTDHTVTLTNSAGGTPLTAKAGTMTSWFFPLTTDGTYTASVVASNAGGSSLATASAALAYTAVPGNVPGTPRDLRVATYQTGTAGQTGFVVAWDPPNSGDPLTSYTVIVGGGPTAFADRMATSTILTYAPVADGTYTVKVLAGNDAGPGVAATTTVTVDASKIPADSVDWSALFSDDTEAGWKQLQDDLTGATDAMFWTQVIDALADAGNLYGGVASFTEQLAMARFLQTVITRPVNGVSTPGQTTTLAGRLALENPAGENPFVRFPSSPPSSPWAGDQLVLWRRAAVIRNQAGIASLPIRRRLQALDLALSLYLGVVPMDNTPGQ